VRDSGGNVIGFRGICRDITERRQAELEILKIEKLESIGVLAGGIAHDFNNILTAVLGNISLARLADTMSPKAQRQLADAEKSVERARDLTQQLLTFAKGGAPVKKTASIAELLRDSCEFALRGSNVRCEFAFQDPLARATWTSRNSAVCSPILS
jgi:signal transduction histidine kinase